MPLVRIPRLLFFPRLLRQGVSLRQAGVPKQFPERLVHGVSSWAACGGLSSRRPEGSITRDGAVTVRPYGVIMDETPPVMSGKFCGPQRHGTKRFRQNSTFDRLHPGRSCSYAAPLLHGVDGLMVAAVFACPSVRVSDKYTIRPRSRPEPWGLWP